MGVTLKRWEISDAAALAEVFQKTDRRWLSDETPDNIWGAEAFIKNRACSSDIIMAIVYDGNIVGQIGVEKLDPASAEIGYCLITEYEGRGITTDAVRQICEIAFAELGVVRIQAKVFETNISSKKVLEKAGFTLESILDKSVIKNETYYNECLYAKFKED